MSLKVEQLSAIKAVYEGRSVFVCLPTGYGKSKLCRLLWNTNLVEIEQRSAFAETTCTSVHQKLLQLLNGEMSWKENSSPLGLWPYQ